MIAVITAALEFLTLLLKALFKSCAKRKNEKSKRTTETGKNPEKSERVASNNSPHPKKHRRASITEKKVQTTETTTIYELSRDSSNSSPDPQETPKVQF